MATSGSQKKPVFGTKSRDGFFYFVAVCIVALTLTPADAFTQKENRTSRQFSHAKAAIVVDPNKSVIYAKNQDVKLPPASTTKLITAMVALDNLSPETIVVISPDAAKVRSIPPRLRINEILTVNDLLHLALMKSTNSAAAALAEEVAGSEERFAELMNKKAESIGALNTKFVNASGLPEGVQYTTVYDLTLIMNEALKYPLIKEILGKKECSITTPEGRTLALRNTNKLLWADDNMIGGKTGFTNSARHCFVGAFQTDAGPVVTAVLGTSSRNRLWRSTEFLSALGNVPQRIASFKTDVSATSSKIKTKVVKFKKKRHNRHLSQQNSDTRLARKTRPNLPKS